MGATTTRQSSSAAPRQRFPLTACCSSLSQGRPGPLGAALVVWPQAAVREARLVWGRGLSGVSVEGAAAWAHTLWAFQKQHTFAWVLSPCTRPGRWWRGGALGLPAHSHLLLFPCSRRQWAGWTTFLDPAAKNKPYDQGHLDCSTPGSRVQGLRSHCYHLVVSTEAPARTGVPSPGPGPCPLQARHCDWGDDALPWEGGQPPPSLCSGW